MNKSNDVQVINFYLCGGCGANIGQQANLLEISDFIGFGQPNIIIIDSSKSNISANSKYKLELIPGLDGFGKDRAEAFRIVSNHIPDLVKRNMPAALNVVVFGASGGTGSVIGPLLIEALLQQDKAVAGIMIQASECKVTTRNTINTIKSLAAISRKVAKPIVISFHDNFAPESSYTLVDEYVLQELRAFAILGSGQNMGLDSQDIKNLVNYNKICGIEPALVDLLINFGSNPEVEMAIATLSILSSTSAPPMDIPRFYSGIGYLPEAALRATKDPIPETHFVITNELMGTRMENLNARFSKFDLVEKQIKDVTYTFSEDTDFVA